MCKNGVEYVDRGWVGGHHHLHAREVLRYSLQDGLAVLRWVALRVALDGRPAVRLASDPPVDVGELRVRVAEWVAALADLDGLEDAGVGHLLDAHPHLHLVWRLVVVGLERARGVRTRRLSVADATV